MHKFIAAWVTPHCAEVESLITKAKDKHPQKKLGDIAVILFMRLMIYMLNVKRFIPR